MSCLRSILSEFCTAHQSKSHVSSHHHQYFCCGVAVVSNCCHCFNSRMEKSLLSYTKGGHAFARQKRNKNLFVPLIQRRGSCPNEISRTTQPTTNSRAPQAKGGPRLTNTALPTDDSPTQ